jgi:hypothetical protein
VIPEPRFGVRLLMPPASDTRIRISRTTPLAVYGPQGRQVAVDNPYFGEVLVYIKHNVEAIWRRVEE